MSFECLTEKLDGFILKQEVDMENIFDVILDEDEKLVKTFKPNKAKFMVSTLFMSTIFTLFFAIVGVLLVLFPDEGVVINKIFVLIPVGAFVLVMLIVWIFAEIYYKNLHFAYSNKRIIIRSGIFGVDFKSLDMSMIGAVNVYVSLIDKILRKNTGTISFGSTSSPLGVGQGVPAYKFSDIILPYETCKEVKQYIDEYKKTLAKK